MGLARMRIPLTLKSALSTHPSPRPLHGRDKAGSDTVSGNWPNSANPTRHFLGFTFEGRKN